MTTTEQQKIGIFGGSFNPLHLGHINSMKTVKAQLGLDFIRVVPTSQSPHRKPVAGPSPDQRLEMVFKGLEDYSDVCVVDDREVVRGGVSYTIDTLKSYLEDSSNEELFLIIGIDQFENFDKWQRFDEILKVSNLVVTSRPGGVLPETLEDFPEGVCPLIEDYSDGVALVKEGKIIQFVQLDDMDISATDIRKRLRDGESVEEHMPLPVRNYIRDHELYESLGRVIGDFEKFTHKCGQLLYTKNGINVQGFDLREMNQPSEFSLIASGTSTRHTSALADHVIRNVKKTYGVFPQKIEGLKEGRWVVLDYGSLMIHLFYDYVRLEYQLERIWQEGISMSIKDMSAPAKNS